MRYAIHLMRWRDGGLPPELLETQVVRATRDQAARQARELLLASRLLDQDDFVVVRRSASGEEVYRWHLKDADRD